MERLEVYKSIDTEREYQDYITNVVAKGNMLEDMRMGEAIAAIHELIHKAQKVWYDDSSSNKYQATMEIIRKISGTCIKMGEKYGMPKRIYIKK